MSGAVAIGLAVVLPGVGLVHLGWLRTGVPLGVLFAAGLNGALVAGSLTPGAAAVAAAGLVTAGAAWLASLGATVYVVWRRLPARSAAERDALFREGLIAYLRGDLAAAARAFQAILRLCRGDVPARLKLAMVYKAQGEAGRATAELWRCRYHDAENAWRWEVERELADLTHREAGA